MSAPTSITAMLDNHAGPSSSSGQTYVVNTNGEEMIEIPSYGVEFFEYRRRLFLAGHPLPPTPSSSTSMPPSYIVRVPPPPAPCPPRAETSSTAVQRLESLLQEPGSEELQETWERGVSVIARNLHAGKRLAKGLRLGLVIKILKASWIQDGLWPKDASGRPTRPPDSPIIEGVELFPQPEPEQRG